MGWETCAGCDGKPAVAQLCIFDMEREKFKLNEMIGEDEKAFQSISCMPPFLMRAAGGSGLGTLMVMNFNASIFLHVRSVMCVVKVRNMSMIFLMNFF